MLNLVFPATAAAFSDEQRSLMTVVGQNISVAVERAQLAQRRLEDREAWFSSLARHAGEVAVVSDRAGKITYASEPARRVLGVDVAGSVADAIMGVFGPEDCDGLSAAFESAVLGAESPVRLVARTRRYPDVPEWLEMTFTNLLDDETIAGVLINAKDVSDRVRHERELEFLATHDHLTGLANRATALSSLALILGEAALDAQVGVLFIDLDGFKLVNDSLGHSAGDELLLAVGRRLRQGVRPNDMLARLGGDEFVMVCRGLRGPESALRCAARVHESLRRPFEVAGRPMSVTASVGVVLTDRPVSTAEELLRDADTAMYRAKEGGRNRTELFDSGQRVRAVARLNLEQDFGRALERDELRLLYQPQVSLADARVVGVEALVAWQHPVRGLLRAGSFVPLAEETGLVGAVTEWVLEQACGFGATRLTGRWSSPPQVPIAVNLAVQHLLEPGLVEMVVGALERTGLDPGGLCLEITETGLATDLDSGIESLRILSDLGVRIAVDDFGTGYSSLVRLRRFPVDTLKIDQSFVSGLCRSTEDAVIVKSVIDLARALGLEVVAEGVEHDEQRRRLLELGCSRGQGYLFSEAVPADTMLGLLECPRGP